MSLSRWFNVSIIFSNGGYACYTADGCKKITCMHIITFFSADRNETFGDIKGSVVPLDIRHANFDVFITLRKYLPAKGWAIFFFPSWFLVYRNSDYELRQNTVVVVVITIISSTSSSSSWKLLLQIEWVQPTPSPPHHRRQHSYTNHPYNLPHHTTVALLWSVIFHGLLKRVVVVRTICHWTTPSKTKFDHRSRKKARKL